MIDMGLIEKLKKEALNRCNDRIRRAKELHKDDTLNLEIDRDGFNYITSKMKKDRGL
jgi:predicted transcriptional regulator